MDITVIVVAGLASLPGIGALVKSIIDSKVTKQEIGRKVDGEAYDRARLLYDDLLQKAQQDRDFLRARLEEAQSQLAEADRQLATLRKKSEEERKFLQHQQAELQGEINRLKVILREVGIPVDDTEMTE